MVWLLVKRYEREIFQVNLQTDIDIEEDFSQKVIFLFQS